MKKNKQTNDFDYRYFSGSEETVYRNDESKKLEIIKKQKTKKIKKISFNVLSFVLVFAIVISSLYIGKKGIEKFLVLRQEEKNHSLSMIPDDVKKDLESMTEEERWAYLYEMYPELLDKK